MIRSSMRKPKREHRYIKYLEAITEARKAEIKRLKALTESSEKQANKLRDYLIQGKLI